MAPQNATDDDPRTDQMKRDMANHFEQFEADYRNNDWGSIVYEDPEVVVVADHKGYEFEQWRDCFDTVGIEFSKIMHDLARQVTDRDWSADYPLVYDKFEGS